MFTRKVYIKHVSLTSMQEYGFEPTDLGHAEDEIYANFGKLTLISCLTKKQPKIVEMLYQGYKRKEIAEKMGGSLQAVVFVDHI